MKLVGDILTWTGLVLASVAGISISLIVTVSATRWGERRGMSRIGAMTVGGIAGCASMFGFWIVFGPLLILRQRRELTDTQHA